MEVLGDSYRANGFEFRKVKRQGDVAWFSFGNNHEVFLVKKAPAAEIFGRQYPDREIVPGNEEWGSVGWSYITPEAAEKMFNELCENQ